MTMPLRSEDQRDQSRAEWLITETIVPSRNSPRNGNQSKRVATLVIRKSNRKCYVYLLLNIYLITFFFTFDRLTIDLSVKVEQYQQINRRQRLIKRRDLEVKLRLFHVGSEQLLYVFSNIILIGHSLTMRQPEIILSPHTPRKKVLRRRRMLR